MLTICEQINIELIFAERENYNIMQEKFQKNTIYCCF